MSGHPYRIRYDFRREVGKFQKEDANGKGLTDAFIFHSILFPEDGSRDEAITSFDGRTGEDLPPEEMFKSMVAMAHAILEDEASMNWHRASAGVLLGSVQSILGHAEQSMDTGLLVQELMMNPNRREKR